MASRLVLCEKEGMRGEDSEDDYEERMTDDCSPSSRKTQNTRDDDHHGVRLHRIPGLFTRTKNPHWCPSSELSPGLPIVIDSRNVLAYDLYGFVKAHMPAVLEQHGANTDVWKQHGADADAWKQHGADADDWETRTDPPHSHMPRTAQTRFVVLQHMFLDVFTCALRFLLRALKVRSGRPVYILQDGKAGGCKPSDELIKSAVSRAEAKGNRCIPVILNIIIAKVALETNCIYVICPGEADDKVASLANTLKGVAVSDDCDVFARAANRMTAYELVRETLKSGSEYTKQWPDLREKPYTSETCVYQKRSDVIDVLCRENKTKTKTKTSELSPDQKEYEAILTQYKNSGLPDVQSIEDVLSDCAVATTMAEMYEHTENNLRAQLDLKFSEYVKTGNRIQMITGVRNDVASEDNSDSEHPSATRVTAELRYACWFRILRELQLSEANLLLVEALQIDEFDRPTRGSAVCDWTRAIDSFRVRPEIQVSVNEGNVREFVELMCTNEWEGCVDANIENVRHVSIVLTLMGEDFHDVDTAEKAVEQSVGLMATQHEWVLWLMIAFREHFSPTVSGDEFVGSL
jgi:hypothetical protein